MTLDDLLNELENIRERHGGHGFMEVQICTGYHDRKHNFAQPVLRMWRDDTGKDFVGIFNPH